MVCYGHIYVYVFWSQSYVMDFFPSNLHCIQRLQIFGLWNDEVINNSESVILLAGSISIWKPFGQEFLNTMFFNHFQLHTYKYDTKGTPYDTRYPLWYKVPLMRYRVLIKYCVFFQEFSKVCHLSLASSRLLLVEQKITSQ